MSLGEPVQQEGGWPRSQAAQENGCLIRLHVKRFGILEFRSAHRCMVLVSDGACGADDDLRRQPHRRAQAPEGAVAEDDVTAMRAGDVAGDGKAEPGAALVLVARLVEAN